MTKKMMIIAIAAIFLLQGFVMTAAGQEVQKEVPKKIKKLMDKVLKSLEKATKAEKPEKKDKYYAEAAKLCNDVLAIDSKFAPAYFMLSGISMKKKDMKGYVDNLHKALEADPTYEKAQLQLIKFYDAQARGFLQKKDVKKAIEFQEKMLAIPALKAKIPQKYAMTLYSLGYFYSTLKDIKKGNDYLKKYMGTFKAGTETAQYHFSVYMIGMNSYNTMVAEIEAKGLKTKIKELNAYAASCSDVEKYLVQTIKAPAQKWTEDAFYNLGIYYIYKGEKAKAKETIEKLIATYPQSTKIEDYKGVLNNAIAKMK